MLLLARLTPVLLALALIAIPARGAVRTVSYSINIESNACASYDDFARLVRARIQDGVTRVTFDADISIDIRVTQTPLGARGLITLLRSGHASTRHIDAENCNEALDALALIASIVLDNEVNERRRPIATLDRGEEDLEWDDVVAEPIAPRAPSLGWSLVTGGGLLFTAGLNLDARAAMGSLTGRKPARNSLFAWDVGAYVAYAPSAGPPPSQVGGTSPAETGRALWVAGISTCPLAWPPGPMRLRGCGSFEGGGLTVATRETRLGVSKFDTVAWFAAGVGARWQWAVSSRFEIDLGMGIVFPLASHDTSGEIGAVAVRGSIGAAYVLPL